MPDQPAEHEGEGAPPELSRNIYVVSVVSFFQDTASEILYPVLPFFVTGVLGAPPAVLGLIEGLADGTASAVKAARDGSRISATAARWSPRLRDLGVRQVPPGTRRRVADGPRGALHRSGRQGTARPAPRRDHRRRDHAREPGTRLRVPPRSGHRRRRRRPAHRTRPLPARRPTVRAAAVDRRHPRRPQRRARVPHP